MEWSSELLRGIAALGTDSNKRDTTSQHKDNSKGSIVSTTLSELWVWASSTILKGTRFIPRNIYSPKKIREIYLERSVQLLEC